MHCYSGSGGIARSVLHSRGLPKKRINIRGRAGQMGRELMVWLAAGMLLSMGAASAEAQERKSAAARQTKAQAERIAARAARPIPLRYEPAVFATARPFRASRALPLAQTTHSESITVPEGQGRRKITLFRFDSAIGDVAVQPVAGSVNGAQLSLGF